MASGVVRDRFIVVAFALVGEATGVVGLGIFRIEADGFGAVRNRFVVFALLA